MELFTLSNGEHQRKKSRTQSFTVNGPQLQLHMKEATLDFCPLLKIFPSFSPYPLWRKDGSFDSLIFWLSVCLSIPTIIIQRIHGQLFHNETFCIGGAPRKNMNNMKQASGVGTPLQGRRRLPSPSGNPGSATAKFVFHNVEVLHINSTCSGQNKPNMEHWVWHIKTNPTWPLHRLICSQWYLRRQVG